MALRQPLTAPSGGTPRKLPKAARILIVDDSAVARAVIARTIASQAHYEVVGAVANADAALRFLTDNRVDVILLDLEMPGVDGMKALPDLLSAGKGARILVVSASCKEKSAITAKALKLGAADTLVKPVSGQPSRGFTQLLGKIARLVDVDNDDVEDAASIGGAALGDSEFDIVAIGASTGGIHAISKVLRAIPASFEVPILVTQHLPGSFMPYFAAQLSVLAGRACDIAVDRMRIRPGRIIIAPGDAHLHCVSLSDGHAVRLSTKPVASGHMPSVDPMFKTVASQFGNRALAIVLSGMGRDGADGARAIADAGGSVVVQDKESSVVWGMPGAVAASGIPHVVLPPDDIGRLVAGQRRPSC